MDEVELLKKLNNLKESYKTLEKITVLKNKLNYFEITRTEKTEIVHSNVLAWLFNPKSNHNLQGVFLSVFANRVGLHLTKNQIENTIVKREYIKNNKKLDILITDKSTYVLAIENKIDASEGDKQLFNYKAIIDEDFYYVCASDRHFVYLTPKGEKPSKEEDQKNWKTAGYDLIDKLLKEILEKSSINCQTRDFLEQYHTVLGRDILKTKDEVKEKCEEIYKEHEKAIDLIYKHHLKKKEIIKRILIDILKDKDFQCRKAKDANLKFISDRLNRIIKDIYEKSEYKPIYYEFKIGDDSPKLILYLYIKLKDLKPKYKSKLEIATGIEGNEQLLFPDAKSHRGKDHNSLWQLEFLSKDEYEEFKIENIVGIILVKMKEFNEKRKDFENYFEEFFKKNK
ncbi:MAG: PDDEXK-like family protein [Candidatus Heimdallarchaeota archaeon]